MMLIRPSAQPRSPSNLVSNGVVWIASLLGAIACLVSSDIRPPLDADVLPVELKDVHQFRSAICRPLPRPCQIPQRQAELHIPLSFDARLVGSIETM